jgi:hypothetical protein
VLKACFPCRSLALGGHWRQGGYAADNLPQTMLMAFLILSGSDLPPPPLSLRQIYGLVWFILHPQFDFSGTQHITSDTFLFWFLVVGMNAPWGIVPVILWVQSFRAIVQGMAATEEKADSRKVQ